MSDREPFEFRVDEFENLPSFRSPEQFAESQERLSKLSKSEAINFQQLGDWVNENLINCMAQGFEPSDTETQKVITQHFLWANTVWNLDKQSYLELAEMYLHEPRYQGFYERMNPGLGEFLAAGMKSYANSML